MKLEHFLGSNVPEYAILSHTWDKEEVLYKDIMGPYEHFSSQTGFHKVFGCCRQARRDKILYVWIDSCCINSDSSAELSEAINSMYQWYRNAKVCYTYLSDVGFHKKDFAESRWFSRGWSVTALRLLTNAHRASSIFYPILTSITPFWKTIKLDSLIRLLLMQDSTRTHSAKETVLL